MRRATMPVVAAEPMFVVVSGLPGSGKSSLARKLGTSLGVEVIDKDDFLETLFADHDEIDVDLRQVLSRAADDALQQRAETVASAIVVSFWRRASLSPTAGTPTDWLESLPNVVEIYCRCSADVAVSRFRSRSRHVGHLDARRTPEELRAQCEALTKLGPLGIGRLIVVDTETDVNVDELVEAVRLAARSIS
jgi:cytidylate kinase